MPKSPRTARQKPGPGERRASSRFALRGAALFRWRTADGQWHDGNGTSCNLGRAGAFIESEATLSTGSQLEIVVTLPIESGSDTELRLCGTGEVRHVHRASRERSGFGAWAVFRTDAAGHREQPQQAELSDEKLQGSAEADAARAPQLRSNAQPATRRLKNTAVQREGRKVQ